ncbi:MAG: triose-phosphate isomerase [Eggerthellaceae bacterium]|nr:triose-phosphate isomerase [Eggerthellaceae bacterium]
MARKPLIAGNWKMNNTISEAVVLAQEICNRFEKEWADAVDVAVIPPFVDIKPVKTVLDFDRVPVAVGAQNVYWEASGAFTGEISVPMLKEIGCKYCIVGHSERRQYFAETNEFVNRKAKALIAGGITPIICVGESLAVRDAGDAIEFVSAQVEAAFAGIFAEEAAKCVLAYEPIWAIGTGRTATPEQAEEVCAAIRSVVARLYGEDLAARIRVLYGGSMKPSNVKGLIAQPDIDGGLIGGASLQANDFIELVKACC